MLSAVLVTVCSPRLVGCVGHNDLRVIESDGFHHLTEQTVREYDCGHSVLIREVERACYAVSHFLYSRGSENDDVVIAVTYALCDLVVVRLRRLDAAETGTAAHYVDDDAGQIRTRDIGYTLGFKGNSGRGR